MPRELDDESGRRTVAELNRAAVSLDDIAVDVESGSAAIADSGLVEPGEAFEDVFPLVRNEDPRRRSGEIWQAGLAVNVRCA